MEMVIERFSIFLVRLDPTAGAETAKTRPCAIVSPDELNRSLATIIIAPMTSVRRAWPTRIEIIFQGKSGEIARPNPHGGQNPSGETPRQIGFGNRECRPGHVGRTLCPLIFI
jgi:hypothetical protein